MFLQVELKQKLKESQEALGEMDSELRAVRKSIADLDKDVSVL